MRLVAGTVIAERFRLVRELGEGGMGAVWLAHHQGLDIPCVIKFIRAEVADSAEIRARFEREAKSAAQSRHSNVVQLLDHGVFDGTPYIAMEYLDGEDLSARLERVGRLDPRATLAITVQIAKALTRAHAAGLVHRDLKPANVFLVQDDGHDLVKVLDFGVVKSSAPDAVGAGTKTGALIGTPSYMSPEQARGNKAVDHRSDLWALAVIVFECVTGRLPFTSDALGDLLIKIATDPIPVPSTVAPDLPAAFDGWWIRAVMRDPDQRYQSAKELVDALALALGATPINAGHEGGYPRASDPVLDRASDQHPRANPWAPTLAADSSGAPAQTLLEGTSSQPIVPTPPRSRLRPTLAVLGVAGAGAIGVLVVAVRMLSAHPPTRPVVTDPPTMAAPDPPTTAAPDPAPTPRVLPTATLPDPTSSPSATAVPSSSPPVKPAPATMGASSKPPALVGKPPGRGQGCNPPYVIDSAGDRHIKPQCL